MPQVKNSTRWQFIVTHRVEMQQRGGSSQKLRPRRGGDVGEGETWPKGDAANVTHENEQRTQAPGPIPAQSYSREAPHTEAAPVLLLSLCKKKNALEPIFWSQRLLNTHTKKNKKEKRAKKKKKGNLMESRLI